MNKKTKIIIGLIISLILISASIFAFYLRGHFRVPSKFYFLFFLLGVGIYGYKKNIYFLRYITLLLSLAYLGFYHGSCLCSTGSLEMVFMYIGLGKYSYIGASLLRISILFIIAYFIGNIFCGWVCHKGAVQEFLYRENFSIKVPEKIDFLLKKLRYFFLALIIFYPILNGKRIFNRIDPFKALFNLQGVYYIVIFLAIILILSIFIYRPFCRYICPLGAFLGLANRFGLFTISSIKPDKCINKKICEKKCPSQTLKMKDKPIINKEYCFLCLECERRCPFSCLGH